MRSKFSVFGHPLHPMLITLPIGLFTWAFLADLIYLVTDRDMTWYDISYWTGIAAVVAGIVAALPGFGDYFTMAVRSNARGIATVHMILNLAVVGLFVVAALLQFDEGATSGTNLTAVVLAHLIGVGLLALSGWLGGEMAYRHHLAMIPDNAEQERTEHALHELRPEARR